jgi:hypothetical protein
MIEYMKRTRDYYAGLGYPAYEWAHFEETPFAPLKKPLGESTIVLMTTAAPYRPELGDQGPGAAYNSAAKFYKVYQTPVEPAPDLRISHIAYDRDHSPADDVNAYLPLAQLKAAAKRGVIASVAKELVGLPTNRSQRTTMDQDAPAAFEIAQSLGADAAILVPNCPVCHQSVSLVSRHLEAQGIPTVVMGCARDIVTHCGVARFLFSNFPLGNSAGKPHDERSQRESLGLALELLESARSANTVWASQQRWAETDAWEQDFSNIDKLSDEEIARRRADFEKQKSIAKAVTN